MKCRKKKNKDGGWVLHKRKWKLSKANRKLHAAMKPAQFYIYAHTCTHKHLSQLSETSACLTQPLGWPSTSIFVTNANSRVFSEFRENSSACELFLLGYSTLHSYSIVSGLWGLFYFLIKLKGVRVIVPFSTCKLIFTLVSPVSLHIESSEKKAFFY